MCVFFVCLVVFFCDIFWWLVAVSLFCLCFFFFFCVLLFFVVVSCWLSFLNIVFVHGYFNGFDCFYAWNDHKNMGFAFSSGEFLAILVALLDIFWCSYRCVSFWIYHPAILIYLILLE